MNKVARFKNHYDIIHDAFSDIMDDYNAMLKKCRSKLAPITFKDIEEKINNNLYSDSIELFEDFDMVITHTVRNAHRNSKVFKPTDIYTKISEFLDTTWRREAYKLRGGDDLDKIKKMPSTRSSYRTFDNVSELKDIRTCRVLPFTPPSSLMKSINRQNPIQIPGKKANNNKTVASDSLKDFTSDSVIVQLLKFQCMLRLYFLYCVIHIIYLYIITQ